jgi:hypothetical protein
VQLTRLISLSLLAVLLVSACKSSDDKLAEAAARGNAAYKQYKTSDYQTAKAALLDFIKFLDQLTASDPRFANMCNEDATLSYLRLAKLEQKNNGSDEARYMAEAISRCEKGSVKDKGTSCSAVALRTMVDKVDAIPPK